MSGQRGFWYGVLLDGSRFLGTWFFVLVSRIIAAGFFTLFFFGRVRESRRFYRILFPEKNTLFHAWCAFRQYQNFTTIHLDRFLADTGRPLRFTSEGWEQIEACRKSTGAILLMSHLGNWEMAAHLLKQQQDDLDLMLIMGVRDREQIEHRQKEELRKAGIRIIGIEEGGDGSAALVEAISFLRQGGLVSLTGDRLWTPAQRRIRIPFLGGSAFLPAAPFLFALLSGAPLHAFFTFRTGPGNYHFSLSPPIRVQADNRSDRDRAVTEAARQYGLLLEQMLRTHPCEWYHFDRFVRDIPASPADTGRPPV
jgi:predicted LPLAT superfamily acyltransferase